jgi:hypothetical protein
MSIRNHGVSEMEIKTDCSASETISISQRAARRGRWGNDYAAGS